MLGFLYGGGDIVQASFDGIEGKIEVGFTGQRLESGGESGGAVEVLKNSIVLGQKLIMGGEALNHVVKVGSDGTQLLWVEDAEEVSKHSFGEDRGHGGRES